ncbi:MAG TPA: hypothetical protein P5243_00600 [Bacteroidales bacterium]|jgi:hypothetical protein|nr:hypothetical protein [Bacteroidales bacterium]HRS17973.1 hypothetical protein [Bacteroidales bacterium]
MSKQVIGFIVVCLVSIHASFAQYNFFTAQTNDSLTTDFYKRSLRVTTIVLYQMNVHDIGASFFIHNSLDRISYYIECKTNLPGRYVITGNQLQGLGVSQMIVPYRSFSCNIGIARAVTRNWFVYAAPGFVAQRTYYTNTENSLFTYTIPKHGMWYTATFGGMYAANNKLSAQAGIDIFNKNLLVGIGYTF